MTGSGYGESPEYEPTQQFPPQQASPPYGGQPYGSQQYGGQQYGGQQYGGQQYGAPAPGERPYPAQQYAQPGQPHGPNPYGRSPVTYEFGVVGTVTAAIGAIFAVIAFTAVDWFKGGIGFSDVGNILDSEGGNAPQPAAGYFSWLGWLLLIVTVVLCIAACTPSPAAQALRAIGAILAAISIAVTFFAIRFTDGPGYTQYLKNARVGFYFAILGFVLMGIGALIGPRRREG